MVQAAETVLEPTGGEVKPSPVVTEPTEPVEPQPEPTPEEREAQREARLAELEGLQSKHADEIKKAQADAEERIRRIQSVKDAEVAEATRRATEQTRRQATFDSLVDLAQASDQGDVDAAERLQKALRDPVLSEVWAWGHRANQPQAVQDAVFQAQVGQLNTIQQALEAHEAFKELGRDKMMEILAASPRENGASDYILNLAAALADYKAEKLAEKLLQDKLAEHEEAVKAKVLEGERAKSGGVAELRGVGGKAPTFAQIEEAYTRGDISSAEYAKARAEHDASRR